MTAIHAFAIKRARLADIHAKCPLDTTEGTTEGKCGWGHAGIPDRDVNKISLRMAGLLAHNPPIPFLVNLHNILVVELLDIQWQMPK
jgi:hypothetical protein